MDTQMDTQKAKTKIDRNPADWREARRLQAWRLKQKGWKQTLIAEALGVTEGAVSQWVSKAREDGTEALYSQKHPGPEPALKQHDLECLPKLLSKAAQHYGFRGNRWTRARVAKIIQEHFGVSYSKQHVGRLLAQIGWTYQKPNRRAAERDEEAIAAWPDEKWQELKKSRSGG
jgi:transposase